MEPTGLGASERVRRQVYRADTMHTERAERKMAIPARAPSLPRSPPRCGVDLEPGAQLVPSPGFRRAVVRRSSDQGLGIGMSADVTGMSRATITAGLRELEQPARLRAAEATLVRRAGCGRKHTETDAALWAELDALIDQGWVSGHRTRHG